MCDKMAISAYILKTVENDPFLRLQMRAKEDFNRHQLFSTNKQYVKIKLMQNETKVKVSCYHGNKSTILLFNSIFRTTPEVSSKLYFVQIS